ncbi:MAG: transcriptional regulator [Synechococcales bacterium]|nr:transcriptional regulator [Synechococcales bacterium]
MTKTLEPTVYGQLLAQSQPKPIHSETEYDMAVQTVEDLMDQESLTPEERMLLKVWMILIKDYENKTITLPEATPLEVLLHLMEMRSLKQVDLVGVIGSKGSVSAVVNGKRSISKAQAKALGEFFNLSHRLFL